MRKVKITPEKAQKPPKNETKQKRAKGGNININRIITSNSHFIKL